MQHNSIRARVVVFWTLVIALLSAISTTIFSETLLNDSFGFSLMVFAAIGLLLNIAHILLHTLFEICNPSH